MFINEYRLVGCFGHNGLLRHYFSLYRTVSQREGKKRRERIDESKNVQTTLVPREGTVDFVVVVALLFYVHGKHLRSCRDGQLT